MAEINERGMRWLKIIMVAGGGYEILMGLAMIFLIQTFFRVLGAKAAINYLIFPRNAGVLAVFIGALMIAAARDPERYILIPLATIVLRLLIQLPILAGILEVPDLTWPLIGFGAFDLLFAAVTGWAIYRSGINWKRW